MFEKWDIDVCQVCLGTGYAPLSIELFDMDYKCEACKGGKTEVDKDVT